MTENRRKIGIAQGDPNGIGWEVILKSLADPRLADLYTLVVYGSPETAVCYQHTLHDTEPVAFNLVESAAEARRGCVNLVACGRTSGVNPGRIDPEAGRAAVEALRRASADLKSGELDALVTAPFDKQAVQSDDFRFTGHTEYFGAEFGGEPLMILCSDVLRVGLVTKHLPVSEIASHITKEAIVRDLHLFRRSLKEDFGIVEPRIAVMALNPHAGDGGLLGREEEEIIRPAIAEAFEAGVLAFGPFAADGLFAGGARPRHGVRHRRPGQGRSAVDAQCDLYGLRYRRASSGLGRMDGRSVAAGRTRTLEPRSLGQGSAPDRKGGTIRKNREFPKTDSVS